MRLLTEKEGPEKKFSDLCKMYHNLNLFGLIQGITLQSCEETYTSIICPLYEQLGLDMDVELDGDLKDCISLKGNNSCGDDSNLICQLFTNDPHRLSDNYFFANPLTRLDNLLSKPLNEMISLLSEDELKDLLDLTRSKMQSYTSKRRKQPEKDNDASLRQLANFFDEIQEHLNSFASKDKFHSVYNYVEDPEISEVIEKFIAKRKESYRHSKNPIWENLKSRISSYPCLLRLEVMKKTEDDRFIGTHSFTIYLKDKHGMTIFQSDFGRFSLGYWLNSSRKRDLERRGIENFCRILKNIEDSSEAVREAASRAYRGCEGAIDIPESAIMMQRTQIEVIPIDESLALTNLEILSEAAKKEYQTVVSELYRGKNIVDPDKVMMEYFKNKYYTSSLRYN